MEDDTNADDDERPKHVIIRDVITADDHTLEVLEEQIQHAFESATQHIIIESAELGDNITKWIITGNFFHKTSVISGLLSMISPLFCPQKYRVFVTLPLCGINLMCTVMYNFSWHRDACCKYQVERNTESLEQLHLKALTTSSPAILVYRDDKYRRRLHNFFSYCCAGYLLYRCCQR